MQSTTYIYHIYTLNTYVTSIYVTYIYHTHVVHILHILCIYIPHMYHTHKLQYKPDLCNTHILCTQKMLMTAYIQYAHLLTVPCLNVDEYILFWMTDKHYLLRLFTIYLSLMNYQTMKVKIWNKFQKKIPEFLRMLKNKN